MQRAAWKDQELPAIARARSLEALRRIRRGEIVVPLACGSCQSTSLTYDGWIKAYHCVACARDTSVAGAHAIRRQKLAEIIRRGVDIDVTRPGRPGPGR